MTGVKPKGEQHDKRTRTDKTLPSPFPLKNNDVFGILRGSTCKNHESAIH
jgi:hypothetical protein